LLIGSDETKNDEIKSPPIWLHQLVLWCLSEAQPNSLYKWSWATNWFCLQPPAPEFVIIIGIDMRKKKWKNVSWQFLPPHQHMQDHEQGQMIIQCSDTGEIYLFTTIWCVHPCKIWTIYLPSFIPHSMYLIWFPYSITPHRGGWKM
jgi:hypothetical protein